MRCTHYVVTVRIGSGPPYYRGFTITLRHTTLGGTPLDELSAQCRDLYLTTHSTHKRERERDRDIHAPGGIRTHNSNKRPAVDPHLKQRGQRDRLSLFSHQIVFALSNQEE
jgi:hypothetical protein